MVVSPPDALGESPEVTLVVPVLSDRPFADAASGDRVEAAISGI